MALEKLSKKSYGIYMAFKKVERVDDWQKPNNAAKNWASKVNYELWRRIDPQFVGIEDSTFVNRPHEDEIRSEVDREAALMKAFNKLQERGGGAASAT